MKKIIKELLPYLIIVVVVVLIRAFIMTPVRVEGSSMAPKLKENDILILNKMDRSFERFDIVVVEYNGSRLVKRIIGLPNEEVEYSGGKLYINGKYMKEDFLDIQTSDFSLEELGYDTIPEDYYFVVGDNRGNSMDSRMIGFISKEKVLGTTSFAIFPFNKFGTIN